MAVKLPNKVRISNISINGFRGANKEICFDCESNGKNLVLFGYNGDGKTTISDAIEWFFTDRIHYLQREGCGREDYFNKYIPINENGEVEICFDDDTYNCRKTLIRKGGSSFSNDNIDFQAYLFMSAKESFILRHHTMREFIDKRKKEKLEKLEEIIGFGVVTEIRDTFLKTLNGLRNDADFSSLKGQRNERKRDIVEIVGKDDFQDSDVLICADKIAKECDSSLSISTAVNFKEVVERLKIAVSSSEKGKQIVLLEEIKGNISNLTTLSSIQNEIKGVVETHDALAKEQKTIEAAAIEKLYRAAIEAIENQLVEVGKCPLCKTPLNTESLVASLKAEIEQIAVLLEKRKEIVEEAKSAQDKLTIFYGGLSKILSLSGDIKKEILSDSLNQILQRISEQISENNKLLNAIQQTLKPVSVPSHMQFDNLEAEIAQNQGTIDKKKQSLMETEEEKQFYQNITKLQSLYSDFTRYKQLNRQIDVFEAQVKTLAKISADFEEMERTSIQQILKALSHDINEFFRFLHPDDNIDGIELITTEERGVEFKLIRHGQEISPPLKILSEAHLNSLGICVFLASAKYFNKVNGFLVLDDVVTSFDIEHRRPLARLISEKLSDYQYLLFTHDELWFQMLKEDLPQGKWVFKELTKWTKDDGIDVIESPIELEERIKNYLYKENDIPGAANKCRILIEEVLKEKCEKLGVRGMEFRIGYKNDKRDPRELIDALASYLKDNQTLRQQESKKSFDHLRATQLITNLGSHHQTFKTTALHRGDIETGLRDINDLKSLFICDKCGTEPAIKYSPQNSKLKNCKCGEYKI